MIRRLIWRIPLTLAATLAVLVAAGYWVLVGMDFNDYRPQIITNVEKATGRSFDIGEEFTVGFSIRNGLVIRANNLVLGNPDWASRPQMLKIGRVEAGVSLLPLLSGKLKIRHLDLNGVELSLEPGPDGQPNWVLGANTGGGKGLDIELQSFAIGSGAVQWHTADPSVRPYVTIAALDLEGVFEASRLSVKGTAEANGIDIDLQAKVTRSPGSWSVDPLSLKTVRSDLSGGISVETTGDRVELTADLKGTQLDLRDFGLQEPRSSKGSAAATSNDTLLSTTPIPLPALDAFDARLNLRVERLAHIGRPLQPVDLSATLRAGRLTLDSFSATLGGGGILKGEAALDTSVSPPSWTVDMDLDKAAAGGIFLAGDAPIIRAPLDLSVKLETRGASTQQMATNLSGSGRLVVGKGRAQLKTIDNLVGGISTLTGQLLERGEGDAQLNCIIGDWLVENGVATPRVALIDSGVSTVRGDGTIDLGRERIEMTFRPRPKKPTLNVAVPVHVRGSLHKPTFHADRTASLTKLIGVASAFVYPPAAIAALGDLGAAGDACGNLLKGGAPPPPEASTAERVTEGVGNAAKSIERGFKSLFND